MPESVNKSLIILIYFVLTLTVLAAFWPVCNFDFINYDDNLYIYENSHVLSGFNLGSIASAFTTPNSGNWLPFTWLSFMLDCQLFGSNPHWMHFVNLLLHIANTLLLFAVLKKMTGSLWPSAFVAAVFAIHPMHVESVAWITERKDVLSTFFFLLTLTAYVTYVKRRTVLNYLLTLLLFAFGLLTKPMLVSVPFLFLLLDYWPLARFEKQSKQQSRKSAHVPNAPKIQYRAILIEKIPFFILALISSVITFLVQKGSGALPDVNALPLKIRITNAAVSYAAYIGKMFWPQNMAIFYPFGLTAFPLWKIIACSLILLLITILVITIGRKQKYLPVGWFWFIVTLIPVIGLIQSGGQAYADRYTYISYIGLFIMLAWGISPLLSKWPHRKFVYVSASAIIFAALAICTYIQTGYWKNTTTLFEHAIKVTRNNYIANFCLGEEFRKQGKPALAIDYYTKALQSNPEYAKASLALGVALAQQGDVNKAVESFQKTLELKSQSAAVYAYAHNDLGVALRSQGKFDQALAQFAQAVQIMPDLADARNNLAQSLIRQGRLDEALDQLRAVCRLKPASPEPMNDLAWYIATHPELKSRNVNEAIQYASRACQLTHHNNPIFLGTLAAAYASAGRFTEAVDTAKTALNLAANQPGIKNILQHHLALYTKGKPVTELPLKPVADPNK